MSTGYHESDLSDEARDIHRALASLTEELEAVDWYHQRADVTPDEDLKAILIHNRDEEIEHAAMILEHLRRSMPEFDEKLRTYLFTTIPVIEVEEAAQAGEEGESPDKGDESGSSLNIGSLRKGV